MGTTGRGRQGTTGAVVPRGRQPCRPLGTTRFPYGDDRTGTRGDDSPKGRQDSPMGTTGRGRQGTTGTVVSGDESGRQERQPLSSRVAPGDDGPCRPLLSPSCRPVVQESPQKGQSPGTGKCEKKTPTSDSAQPRPLTPRFKVVGRVVVQNFSGSNAGPRWRCRSTLN